MIEALATIGVFAGAVTAALTDATRSDVSRIAKMSASTLVIAILLGGVDDWTAYSVLVLVALACSWVGDLALTFSSRPAFVVGLSAFALAHVAYIAAFVARGGWSWLWFAAGATVMAGVSLLVLRWLEPWRPPELAVPLTAYVIVIGLMVASACATLGSDPDPRIPAAALLFAASDVLVARQRFVQQSMVNRLIGLPTYFAAQLLFVASAV